MLRRSYRLRSAAPIFVFVLASGLVSAACGGDGESDGAQAPSRPSAADAATILHPSDKAGGTLRALSDTDCDYWDPARTYYAPCWNMQRWISRQLLAYAPRPGKPVLVDDLAESVPTSLDGKTWTYTLKEGIRFEDGTPITSKDVKYAVERVFAAKVVNGGPTYVVDFLDDPKNPYPGPYDDRSPDKLGLASVETPDDRTITFHLNQPFADWNYVMALPSVTPVPRASDTGARYTFRPVSSGPYKFSSYTPEKSLVLVRNPEWDRATDSVNKALPDRIEVTMGLSLPDVDERILADQADFYVGQTGVQVSAQARILGDPRLRSSRTINALTGFIRYLIVTTDVEPFDDVHCRNAVAWAADKGAQQLARGGPIAGGDIATTMIPPPLKYYRAFDFFSTPGGRGDIAEAKAELAACGLPNGFETKIACRNSGKESAQAEAVQASLKKIGVKVSIDQYEPSQYLSAQLGIPANMRAKGYGLALAGSGPDWPTPYALLRPIVDGRKILPQGNSNYASLNDPAVNKAIDDGAAAADDGAAQRAWTAADQGVVRSAAYVPLVYDKALNVFSERLTNVYFSPSYLMADFASFGVVP
jgi:peptide/nickel transport system substrate-binding protein